MEYPFPWFTYYTSIYFSIVAFVEVPFKVKTSFALYIWCKLYNRTSTNTTLRRPQIYPIKHDCHTYILYKINGSKRVIMYVIFSIFFCQKFLRGDLQSKRKRKLVQNVNSVNRDLWIFHTFRVNNYHVISINSSHKSSMKTFFIPTIKTFMFTMHHTVWIFTTLTFNSNILNM